MTLLSKKLEEVRTRHSDASAQELAQVIDLGARMKQLDDRLIDALDDVLEEHAQRRAVVHDKLETIARCAGLLPPPPSRTIEPPQIEAGKMALPNVLERERERQIANGHYQQSPAGVQ